MAKLSENMGTLGDIISDRGLACSSRGFGKFVAEKGHVLNAIGLPRANGKVKRVNRS